MNPILRSLVVLLVAGGLSSCVVTTDTVSSGWDGPAATAVVTGATTGMVGYYAPVRPAYYGAGYYRRPYYGSSYVGRSVARGYHRPYVGARPGRF